MDSEVLLARNFLMGYNLTMARTFAMGFSKPLARIPLLGFKVPVARMLELGYNKLLAHITLYHEVKSLSNPDPKEAKSQMRGTFPILFKPAAQFYLLTVAVSP